MRHTTKGHFGLLLPGGDRPRREGLSCGGDRLGRRRRPLAAQKGVEHGERWGGLKGPFFSRSWTIVKSAGRLRAVCTHFLVRTGPAREHVKLSEHAEYSALGERMAQACLCGEPPQGPRTPC